MRGLLAAAGSLLLLHTGGTAVHWRVARISDSVVRRNVIWENWDLRAVSPNGQRAIVVRFWTKGNTGPTVEWLVYRRKYGAAGSTEGDRFEKHHGPGVSMTGSCNPNSLRSTGSRWVLDACGSPDLMKVHLVLRAVRPGLTVGPLRAGGKPAYWLSVVSTGLVDGVVSGSFGKWRLRGWFGAQEHEWGKYRYYNWQTYPRRDEALIWRSANDIRLVVGVEPYRGGQSQVYRPDDRVWRGVSATLGARLSACSARVHRGGVVTPAQLQNVFPATKLTALCGGSRLAVRHLHSPLGGTEWDFGMTVTGLATSNIGGVGFLEEFVPSLH